eukprot:gene6607-9417_t
MEEETETLQSCSVDKQDRVLIPFVMASGINVRCIDSVGIGTANVSATISFLENVLGFEHKFKDSIHFGRDPAYMVASGNNSAVALCPSSSKDLKHIAFRVSEQMFEKALRVLPELNIQYRTKDIGLKRSIWFRDPVNGYDLIEVQHQFMAMTFDTASPIVILTLVYRLNSLIAGQSPYHPTLINRTLFELDANANANAF